MSGKFSVNVQRALAVLALGSGAAMLWHGGVSGQQATPVAPAPEAVEQAENLSSAFRHASEVVLPSVVRITSTTEPQVIRGTRRSPLPGGENPFRGTPLEEFFNQQFGDDLGGLETERMIPSQRGIGSGVIISEDGIVLTNNHVVEGADEVTVELADGRTLKAKDIRRDKLTDLAILRIEDGEKFPAAKLGDSDKLMIGDWVLAVGQPFGVGVSVSAGIISAKERSLSEVERTRFLQTDAAVNPGNSGGPLVNLQGEVVGINTAIATRTGGYQGISFAVPINSAKWVIERLIESGSVQRAYLGIGIDELTPEYKEQLGLPSRTEGVFVKMVQEGKPAATAGVLAGDVIVAIDDQPVRTTKELQSVVERLPVGSKHELTVLRDGKRQTLTVVLDDFGASVEPTPTEEPKEESKLNSDIGLDVSELTSELAEQLGMEGRSGVVVTRVDRGGVAAESGLRPGMVIIRVGTESVSSVDELNEQLEKASLDRGVFVTVLVPSGRGDIQGTTVLLLKRR